MALLIVMIASGVAGIIQSMTGFGAAILLMLVLPYFFDMVTAPAVASAIAMGLGIALAWKYRRFIEWKLCLLPALIYLAFSVAAIRLVTAVDLENLTLAFGLFLMLLAIYFFAFSKRVTFSANWKTAAACAAFSGATSGLFGIGGPLMAIYFVSATKSKYAYIGNLQFLFGVTNAVNLGMRVSQGIYTPDLLSYTLVGILGINAGKQLGLRALYRLSTNKMKRFIYAFVGLSGALTVLQQLF